MVKKTYIKSSDNKEEANIWRKGLRGCKQREKKKKRENQQKHGESLRHKMSNPYTVSQKL